MTTTDDLPPEPPEPDPGNIDPDLLTVPLDDDDDVFDRLEQPGPEPADADAGPDQR